MDIISNINKMIDLGHYLPMLVRSFIISLTMTFMVYAYIFENILLTNVVRLNILSKLIYTLTLWKHEDKVIKTMRLIADMLCIMTSFNIASSCNLLYCRVEEVTNLAYIGLLSIVIWYNRSVYFLIKEDMLVMKNLIDEQNRLVREYRQDLDHQRQIVARYRQRNRIVIVDDIVLTDSDSDSDQDTDLDTDSDLEERLFGESTKIKLQNVAKYVSKLEYISKDEDSGLIYSDIVDKDHSMCAICLLDYEDFDSLVYLECKHHYHYRCIKKWIEQKAVCPTCKAGL